MKRLLICAVFSLGCSAAPTGPDPWTIRVSNLWDQPLTVTAWNGGNAGQIAQFETVTIPAYGSGCLRFDPNQWGTTMAALEVGIPNVVVIVLGEGFDFQQHGNWLWTVASEPPFATTPRPSDAECPITG